MSTMPTRHRITVADYDRMVETGILTENDRVELINGEILDKMPIGDPHIACILRLTRLFVRRLSDEVHVSVQNPILVVDSEPEPDFTILKPRSDDYGTSKAKASDVLLLVEVADSSLDFDRTVKLDLYARSGIVEYWIVNVMDAEVELHRGPLLSGSYSENTVHKGSDSIEPLAFPGVGFRVDEIVPSTETK